MTVRIEKKIKGYAVVTPDDKAKESARAAEPAPPAAAPEDNVIQMHERIERPEVLIGSPTRSSPRWWSTPCT